MDITNFLLLLLFMGLYFFEEQNIHMVYAVTLIIMIDADKVALLEYDGVHNR
jgi:hypothetical protein